MTLKVNNAMLQATVCVEALKHAEKVFGEAVEEIKHEDNECNLHKGKLYRIF